MTGPEFVAEGDLDDIAALEGVCDSGREVSAAQAAHLLRLARFARRRLTHILETTVDTPEAQERAWRNLVAETACALHLGEGQARNQIDLAWALTSQLTATFDGLTVGRITLEHAKVIVDQSATVPEAARVEFEARLLEAAAVMSPRRLREAAKRLRERLHPETIEARHGKARQERSVWVDAELDGMAVIHHVLSAEDARAILDAVETKVDRVHRGGDIRSVAALRSDVLRDFVLRGETSPAGANDVVPTVVVTIPVETLIGLDDRPADLSGYGAIDAETARRLAAKAPSFARLFVDPIDGSPLALGREKYRPTADMRRVVVLGDETCRFPNCGRPAMYCELDHTEAWADGGRTDLDNLAALCSRHHHIKHEDGWSLEQLEGGVLRWVSPLGRVYETVPKALFDAQYFGVEARPTLATLLEGAPEFEEVLLDPLPPPLVSFDEFELALCGAPPGAVFVDESA
ncbi:HNH endonuclease [Cnuibacter physcomitrellae]|uniref:HNH endonuclease signature motif containing protein n=1 Tax=Cnuibacter physcomitrellae TaxID=1619308 RepID=UPI0021761B61|nr:HNH endonuclease signature motif containing protein [Cnuibacter physcomitrellae]MCS5496132.1 HNH endonuclease [Cnuibacter physcomitrellae]